jgi:ppGpp synthetase/RelA/SpoT-type nucleotidyltranferase
VADKSDTVGAILISYDERFKHYEAFAERLQVLLGQLLRVPGLRAPSITGRVKSREDVEQKLLKPGKNYSQLEDITDICGVRVITYFTGEVDQVAKIIEEEFNLDHNHCVDKRVYQDPDRFGYKSLHYVVSLKPKRTDLPEYSAFKGFKAEVQLRTVIQHAWAEIEHDLGYKSSVAVPKDAKRKLFRLAALLELADEEFAEVKNTLLRRTSEVRADLKRGDLDVEIDSTSLAEFVLADSIIANSDIEIARRCRATLQASSWIGMEALATWLRFVGITTIAQLRSLFVEKRHSIIDLASQRLSKPEVPALTHGVAILYASYYIAATTGGKQRILEFLDRNGFNSGDGNESVATDIMRDYIASAKPGPEPSHSPN